MRHIPERDYRSALRECLARRCTVNPRYSLRAFARDIGISPGQLSSLLSGRKGLSTKTAQQILTRLNLHPREREVYLLQVQRDFSRSTKTRIEAEAALSELLFDFRAKQLTEDMFSAMADWYHLAILQLLSTKNAEKRTSQTAAWISKELGISLAETESALDRLTRIKLLEKTKHLYQVVHESVLSTDEVPSRALRKYHDQVLTKAIRAIEMQPIEERYFNAVMIPIQKNQIAQIKKDILKFQKQMMKKHGRNASGDGEVVYALAQQFFRLSGEAR